MLLVCVCVCVCVRERVSVVHLRDRVGGSEKGCASEKEYDRRLRAEGMSEQQTLVKWVFLPSIKCCF